MIETSAALGACLLVLTVAVAIDRRPYRPGKRNYISIMIVALAASLVLGRHLLSLMACDLQLGLGCSGVLDKICYQE